MAQERERICQYAGGKLLYGVSDSGELIGLDNAEKDAEAISEIIKMQMDPIPQTNLSIHEESIINGLIHRDYLELGSEVHIDIFDDRMDISKASIPCPIGFEGKTIVALNHPHRITSLIREKESGVEYISEGLIATYPIDKIIDRYRIFCGRRTFGYGVLVRWTPQEALRRSE